MSEDQAVQLLKKKWGLEDSTMILVPLQPFIRFIGQSYKAVTIGQATALLAGESGRNLLREIDRVERCLTCELNEMTR